MANNPDAATGVAGETFTERCRRMLTEQPDQLEFTVSRAGLETLVLDSERYAAANQEAVQKHLDAEERAERIRPRSLDEQMEELKTRYPLAHLDPTDYGDHILLWVPGVKRSAKIWKNAEVTLAFLLPKHFPFGQPHRFLTSDDDTLLAHGGQASNIIGQINCGPPHLRQWHWAIRSPKPQHTLLHHVHAARSRFEFGSACELEQSND